MQVEKKTNVFDVAVVGLGPVGAVAAQLLAREGLSVIAIEPALEPYDKPRAIGIDHEALRSLQKLDLPVDLTTIIGPYRTSEYRSADGKVLRRIVPQPEPHPLSWPPYSTFIQPELEQVLRAGFRNWKELEVALGSRCNGVVQSEDGAVLEVEEVATGVRRSVSSHFVVACDGAWSPIRESLGIKFEDLEFDEPWLVVDVIVEDDSGLPQEIIQYCDPARPASLVHGPGKLCRWEIMLQPDENPEDMVRDETVWRLLSPWLRPDQGRLWRAATYRFHALIAEAWQRGRVFLAGDAAHQTPPFMAQGLNQGLRDVANLCWKLGQVRHHGASPALLRTYDEERRPNARAVINMTKAFGRLICERDPQAAAARNQRMLAEMQDGSGVIVRQDLLPPIAGGLLAPAVSGEVHTAGAGTVFPQPWLRSADGVRRMDDVLQVRFALFLGNGAEITRADADRARDLGVMIVHTDGPVDNGIGIQDESGLIAAWLQRHGANAALVRPDHVVFGTADSAAGIAHLLQSLQRQLAGLD